MAAVAERGMAAGRYSVRPVLQSAREFGVSAEFQVSAERRVSAERSIRTSAAT
jgi:hypothetical protein